MLCLSIVLCQQHLLIVALCSTMLVQVCRTAALGRFAGLHLADRTVLCMVILAQLPPIDVASCLQGSEIQEVLKKWQWCAACCMVHLWCLHAEAWQPGCCCTARGTRASLYRQLHQW
jgi:hypothetical protein